MIELMKADPKLRVVLKEFPVLGEARWRRRRSRSRCACRTRPAKKYLEFHQKLFASRGQIDKARALAVAKEVGFDIGAHREGHGRATRSRLTLEESFKLAEALGLNGTPSYVVGNEVVVGAVGVPKLRRRSTPRAAARPPADGRNVGAGSVRLPGGLRSLTRCGPGFPFGA